jgi:type II secretory ATPase GspE/PulE/Tfp pilus assembly ATPase PilB-like protein
MQVMGMLAVIEAGGYVSIVKVVVALLVLMVWARLLTWVDKDAPSIMLPREPLNMPLFGGMLLAFALFFMLPNFFLALGAVLLIFGAEVGVYLNIRKKKSDFDDIKQQFNEWIRGFIGERAEKKSDSAAGSVVLIGKDGKQVEPPEADSPKRAIYDATQTALLEALIKGAEQIELSPETEGLAVKYVVDGVMYRGAVLQAATGAAVISHLKEIAGLNVEEVRKPQTGSFKTVLNRNRRELKVQTDGTRVGEHMRMYVDPRKKTPIPLADLGFSERQLGFIKELIADKQGIILVSSPKGQGLTTTMGGLLRGHDAFLEQIHTISRDAEEEVDGATQNKLPITATAEEESKKVDWIVSQEPDVISMSTIESPQAAIQLINFAKTGKRIYIGLRASSTFEAIDVWRKLIGDDRVALEAVRLVINSRIVRKLCTACKAGYAPDPATLRKLGINPERVTALFQARTQPLRNEKGEPVPCETCQDLNFKGRVGVFETMMVDDEVRTVLGTGRSLNQPFRKQRGRYLQEEALAVVERGETSVQEVLRVLKAAPAPPIAGATPSSSAGGPPRPPAARTAVRKRTGAP